MIKLPQPKQIDARLRAILRPHSKLGKTAVWFGALAVLAQLLRLVTRSQPGTTISGWATFLSFIFLCVLLLLALRWVRLRLMWRLRNRLIVTYVFIGVIPVVLLICMALIAGYLFAGQFATYIVLSDLQTELQHLRTANNALAAQFRTLSAADRLTPQLAAEIASASDENFHQRTVTVLEGTRGYSLQPGASPAETKAKLPEAIKDNFSGFTLEQRALHLRSVRHVEANGKSLIVISNVPVNVRLLQRMAARVGSIQIYPPPPAAKPQDSARKDEPQPKQQNDSVTYNSQTGTELKFDEQSLANSPEVISVGQVPEPANRLDREFKFGTAFTTTDWDSGKQQTAFIAVGTRPSLLYDVLFGTLGKDADIFEQALIGIAIFFGLIELIALIIGIRLTRSVTRSVAELYSATQRVNRGDLTYRIALKSKDQMASLEQSFNSMTTSLARLIAEQKEKQRLESELAIAHEVQNLLFPRDLSDLPTLEVHGVCRPARTVSGDYYDFIRLPDERLVLAVGDISGKGISAALLMATVHAFVRAYSLEPELALAPMLLAGSGSNGSNELYYRGSGMRDGDLAPGRLMATLNYQLFRATPPEKYATMFLGCYDGASQSLIYSNAGHLPPIVISRDGDVTRLQTSGTVVGLFDSISYGESAVPMRPGDIFLAFSDGVTEPENEFGEFGEDRLVELIRLHRDQPLSRISDVVTTAVTDWIGGNEQPDDITVVLARPR